jgi:hypothetical protein
VSSDREIAISATTRTKDALTGHNPAARSRPPSSLPRRGGSAGSKMLRVPEGPSAPVHSNRAQQVTLTDTSPSPLPHPQLLPPSCAGSKLA